MAHGCRAFERGYMKIPRLESERLVLREWLEGDFQPFANMGCDPDVMRFFPKHLTAEESRQFIAKSNATLLEKQFGLWAVEIKESGEFIGFIGLAVPTFETNFTPCTEIGWRLAKESWGKGYATEGAMRVLQYAFKDLGLEEVVSFTSELNLPSIKVMERIGMDRNPAEDFNHPRVEKGHRLERHVLYRREKGAI
jgi:RimJ/RimL family protein N-acetyltransferase